MSDNSLSVIKKTLNSTEIMQRFASFMGEREAAYYINSVVLAVANSATLQECTPNSIVYSALRAASLKLSCDPALGEAYLVPYGKVATFIPGYKGLRNLATRTNKYRYINAGKLRNGEQWIEDALTGKCSIGGKAIDSTKMGWFAFFEMFNGYAKGMYMTTEEIHDHAARYSKSYNNARGLWKTDPESMEKKTVLRLLMVRWGDLGEAGNAFVEDEYVNGEFHDELVPVTSLPEDEPEPVKHTQAENMVALGYSPITEPVHHLPEQDAQPEPAAVENVTSGAPMTLQEAQDTLNSKGTRYGDLDNAKLSFMVNSLAKIASRTPEQENKLLAIQLIFAARNDEAQDDT